MNKFYVYGIGDVVVSRKSTKGNGKTLFMIVNIENNKDVLVMTGDAEGKYNQYLQNTIVEIHEIYPLENGMENKAVLKHSAIDLELFKGRGDVGTLEFLRKINWYHKNKKNKLSDKEEILYEIATISKNEEKKVLKPLTIEQVKMIENMPKGRDVDYIDTEDTDYLLDSINYLKFFAELFNDDSYLEEIEDIETVLQILTGGE